MATIEIGLDGRLSPRLRRACAAAACAAAGALALAPGARADFAPSLSVKLSDSRANRVPVIGASIQQTASENPVRRLTLRFPPGYQWNRGFHAAVCGAEQTRELDCAAGQIGYAFGTAAGVGEIKGGVYWADIGSGPRPVLTLEAFGGAYRETVPATLRMRSNGALDISFEPLPAVTFTSLNLVLMRGGAGIVRNPRTCGRYLVEAKLTSHREELAVAQQPVDVSGCGGAIVSRLSLYPRSFRPGPAATTLGWKSIETTGETPFRVEKKRRKRWKKVGTVVGPGAAGQNLLRFDGKVKGRRLRPGTYRFRLALKGSKQRRTVGFKVLKRR